MNPSDSDKLDGTKEGVLYGMNFDNMDGLHEGVIDGVELGTYDDSVEGIGRYTFIHFTDVFDDIIFDLVFLKI